MGSYVGAESCELVGTYLLCQLPEQIRRQVGLYRDDGLGAFRESPRHIQNIKKQICKVFTNNGLRITIEANKRIVDFLDVTLDLNKGTHEPYTKPSNTPLYVHNESNYPLSITRNILVAINKRLNEISSNKQSFEKAAPLYQSAINQSGYDYQLTFEADITSNVENKTEANNTNQPPKRSRQRKVTWYNPPFSTNVKTNVGRKFLNIVDESFKKGHPLHKIFNKNTFKVSYSCMPSLKSKISVHNKLYLEKSTQPTNPIQKSCNCRDKPSCPLNGECLTSNVVYQATVTSEKSHKTYIGLTEDNFKNRYRNHTASFGDKNKRNATELSKYIWSLKDSFIPYSISWKIIARANSYSNTTKRCNLCLTEKGFLSYANQIYVRLIRETNWQPHAATQRYIYIVKVC